LNIKVSGRKRSLFSLARKGKGGEQLLASWGKRANKKKKVEIFLSPARFTGKEKRTGLLLFSRGKEQVRAKGRKPAQCAVSSLKEKGPACPERGGSEKKKEGEKADLSEEEKRGERKERSELAVEKEKRKGPPS